MCAYIRWLFCCFGYIPGVKYWSEPQAFTEHKITPQVPTNRSFNVSCKTDLMTAFTLNTSKVIAVIAGHIVPSVAIIGTQSVNTVFVFPVVWLLRSPEPKTGYFLVCPDKWSLNASVIKSNPWSLSIMTVLNVDIFFLVVHCYQMWVHCWTVGHSSHPRCAYRAC